MIKKLSTTVTVILITSLYGLVHAAPWYTGPLLAPSGKVVPLGHANIEIYGFSTQRKEIFGNKGKKIHIPEVQSLQLNPLLGYGLTDSIDVQLSLPYARNKTLGKSKDHISDTSILLGFQAHKQQPGSRLPDLRITVQQIIPTGRFDNLNPIDKGTGATGAGGFQNILSLDFQQLTQLTELHYLRTRLALAYMYSFSHDVDGFSAIGGGVDTHGVDKPGDLMTADLAGEFSVTQNWVAVMEMYYTYHAAGLFKGRLGFNEDGLMATVDNPTTTFVSFAPAIEYNFSEHYGIIAGVWFSVQGKNAPVFTSTVIAFNAFW